MSLAYRCIERKVEDAEAGIIEQEEQYAEHEAHMASERSELRWVPMRQRLHGHL